MGGTSLSPTSTPRQHSATHPPKHHIAGSWLAPRLGAGGQKDPWVHGSILSSSCLAQQLLLLWFSALSLYLKDTCQHPADAGTCQSQRAPGAWGLGTLEGSKPERKGGVTQPSKWAALALGVTLSPRARFGPWPGRLWKPKTVWWGWQGRPQGLGPDCPWARGSPGLPRAGFPHMPPRRVNKSPEDSTV